MRFEVLDEPGTWSCGCGCGRRLDGCIAIVERVAPRGDTAIFLGECLAAIPDLALPGSAARDRLPRVRHHRPRRVRAAATVPDARAAWLKANGLKLVRGQLVKVRAP